MVCARRFLKQLPRLACPERNRDEVNGSDRVTFGVRREVSRQRRDAHPIQALPILAVAANAVACRRLDEEFRPPPPGACLRGQHDVGAGGGKPICAKEVFQQDSPGDPVDDQVVNNRAQPGWLPLAVGEQGPAHKWPIFEIEIFSKFRNSRAD